MTPVETLATETPTRARGTEAQAEDGRVDSGAATPDTSAPAGLPQPTPPLRADSTLEAAVTAFRHYMEEAVQGGRPKYSRNTRSAFGNDLKIFMEYIGPDARLMSITTGQINEFLEWLQGARGKPCSPKTLTRRITTVKAIFRWLHEKGVIGTDPAEPVVQISVRTPLPTILRDEEVARLQRAAQDYLFDRKHPDARPYLLVSLLLQTGIKKAECAALLVEDIDVSNPQAPTVSIRYQDTAQAHKNRTLSLHPSIISVLNHYLQDYKPDNFLFACTPRNLEYVLDDVGKRAGIKRVQVGFETLRWTAAVRDYRTGMPEEQLRLKMGLTKISWRETGDKIQQLTGRG